MKGRRERKEERKGRNERREGREGGGRKEKEGRRE